MNSEGSDLGELPISSNRSFQLVIAEGLLFLALAQSIYRYLQLTIGKQVLFVDARAVWKPLAYDVLNGAPLYVGATVDNKPPLFQFINIAVAWTGAYDLVFTLLIGVANGAAAILLWRLLARENQSRAGVIAGLLFLTVVPVVNGLVINVRSLALPFLMGAFLTQNPSQRGAGIAIAGLISQYAVLSIPVAVYDRYKKQDADINRWILVFAISGISVVALAFLIVLPLWGLESMISGLYWSFGVVGQYAGRTTKHTLLGTPVLYFGILAKVILDSLVVTIPGAILGYFTIREILQGMWGIEHLCILLFGTLAFQLLLRSYPYYWLYPIPFLCGVAAIGISRFIANEHPYYHH